jgi:type II pantothenate kinase
MSGHSNAVDLSLADVITGPIGTLPATATAVNFGRLARLPLEASRNDKAAALVNLIGQVIALLAISAARAETPANSPSAAPIVVIGHMTDMQSIQRVFELVSQYYSTPIHVPEQGGYFTALGALLHAEEMILHNA